MGGEVKAQPSVAVCVVTYRRPESLLRLLAALDGLELGSSPPKLEILVVDNDPEESARSVYQEMTERLAYPLGYRVEPRRGIAQARNRAIREVLGRVDFLAFLDDDEVPEPDWLLELMRVQRERDADVVAGPSLPRFVEPPPDWMEDGGFFGYPRHADGVRIGYAYSHNVLMRVAPLAHLDRLFDERMGLMGGEDSELFPRLADAGFRIVWADRAVACEFIPPEKARPAWILRRGFRVGTSSAFIDRLRRGARRAAPRVLLHGTYCIAKGGLLWLANVPHGPAARLRALRLACYGIGRLCGLLGFRYEEYRRTLGR